ncbi:MAG: hypothetical protein JW914_01670 [Syntrophaceae bacterium]|nr:hypothetical protein [Syntrophaceae bacterium]
MTKETFTAKAYTLKIISAFLALSSILLLFAPYIGFPSLVGGWGDYFFAILCIIAAYVCWKVPPPKIEVDEVGIKKLNNSTGPMTRLLQPNSECEWNWIHSISTTRCQDGSLLTILYISEAIPNQPKYRVTIESNIFKDYISILKIIKDRAPQANLDETTSLILKDQIDIRPVRPFFWWLFIIVVIIVFAYIYYNKS